MKKLVKDLNDFRESDYFSYESKCRLWKNRHISLIIDFGEDANKSRMLKKYKSKKEKPISEDEQLLIRKAIKEFCRDLNIATSINLSHDKVFEECLFNHISNN